MALKIFFFFFFWLRFFEIFQKRQTIFIKKKIEQNHDVLVYKKDLVTKHRKSYIFRDINCFVKMSVSMYER